MNFFKKFFGTLPSPELKPIRSEFDAIKARSLTDTMKGPSEEELCTEYLLNCQSAIKAKAGKGDNMAFFHANTFKSYGGIEHFEKLGYKVYFVSGGMYDIDDYRVEW